MLWNYCFWIIIFPRQIYLDVFFGVFFFFFSFFFLFSKTNSFGCFKSIPFDHSRCRHFNHYCCSCRIPLDYLNPMFIGDVTLLWYDVLYSQGCSKATIAYGLNAQPCVQERAGNINALWDRMEEMMHCGKGALPKPEVQKSGI